MKNVKNSRQTALKHSTDFDFSSSILISRGLTCYILREGTRVAWHDDTPFPRRKPSGRACVSRTSLINVHTEPLALILPAYPPHRPRSRSSRPTISRIAIRNNAVIPPLNSRHYRSTLKYGAAIVSLSLSVSVSRRLEDRA